MTTPKTPNLYLYLPNFNLSPWHDEINANFRSIDATIRSLFGLTNLLGEYQNSTAVTTGDRYFDTTTGYYYEALSDFTTMASPNTFATERTTYPARWTLIDAAEALDAATNAAASATAAAASATAAAADAVQTAADRVQTGLDVVATNADAVATAADRVQTAIDSAAAATSASEAAASAAAINFPDPGVALNYVRRNSGNTAWENRTPAQVLGDIGSIAANQFPSPGVALNILRRNAGNTAYENRTPDEFREDISALKKDGSNVGNDAAKTAFLAAIGIDTSGALGDLFYRNASGLLVPKTIGTAGQHLRAAADGSGIPEFASGWETVFVGELAAAAQHDFTGLDAFRQLRITGWVKSSVDATLLLRLGSGGGPTFDSAANYARLFMYHNASAANPLGNYGGDTGFLLYDGTVDTVEGFPFTMDLFEFNNANRTYMLMHAVHLDAAALFRHQLWGSAHLASAANSIRIVAGSGNTSGFLHIQGIRG